jgi:thiol-disulfide isomerase/thioredoxin
MTFKMKHISIIILINLLTLIANTSLLAQTRKVIVEDITGAWCGFCPDGIATLNALSDNFDNIICVAAHVGDPMENSNSAELGDEYSGGGVNVLMLDRYLFSNEQFVQLTSQYAPAAAHLSERLAMPAPVGISLSNITYDSTNQQLSVTVTAQFANNLPNYPDLRFNLWLVEDSVMGTGNAYNQANFYNAYAGHFFYGAGNPISNFVHRHVLRTALGTAWGSVGSIGNGNSVGNQNYSYTYTTTLNPNWNTSRLSLVALVQNYSDEASEREILNAEQISFSTALQSNNNNSPTAVQLPNVLKNQLLYPNPLTPNSDLVLQYELTQAQNVRILLYDQQGAAVLLLDEMQSMGKHSKNWSIHELGLPQGIYTFIIETEQGKTAQQVIIGR